MENRLRKKGLVVAIIVLFVGASVVPSAGMVEISNNGRAILYVGGSGPGNYSKIQDAIDNASDGDTVFVYDDSSPYIENLTIHQTISLIGENRNTTVVDGNKSGYVVSISVDGVTINGFTIQDSDIGIKVRSDCNIIRKNVIIKNKMGLDLYYSNNNIIGNNRIDSNSRNGIWISGSSKNNTVCNNIVCNNNASGIKLMSNCNNNTFYKNDIHNNNYTGLVLSWKCNNNTITNNTISNNKWRGIKLHYSNYNFIVGNHIFSHTYEGIWIGDDIGNESDFNELSGNLITDNQRGIYLDWGHFNIIKCNTFKNNSECGVKIKWEGTFNNLYHNNFVNNTQNAYDECNNSWDNGYPFGGNYWDDYTEDDLYSGPNQDIPGSDGIGDKPYNISGGDSQDHYPLMHHFELYYILNISAPLEVNEGELFNVVVTSMGGTAIPNATVEFNDIIAVTDSDGRVYFTAPTVVEDTLFEITATKEGYTGNTETILVKDVPVEFVSTFMFGRITNLNTTGEHITFEAVNVRAITLSPFSFIPYTSGELITILKDYTGLLGALFGVQFIFATCDAPIG